MQLVYQDNLIAKVCCYFFKSLLLGFPWFHNVNKFAGELIGTGEIGNHLREEEICYYSKACCTRHEDVVIVLSNGRVSCRSRFRDCHGCIVSKQKKGVGKH